MATKKAAPVEKNELLFQEVNDKIAEIGSDFATPLTDDNAVYSFLCECFDADCNKTVGLTLRDYKRVRARPGRFLVVPGHIAEDEKAIEAHDGYWIIEKPPELLGRS